MEEFDAPYEYRFLLRKPRTITDWWREKQRRDLARNGYETREDSESK